MKLTPANKSCQIKIAHVDGALKSLMWTAATTAIEEKKIHLEFFLDN